MIGSGVIEGESQKLFERESVINLGFEFGIGTDMEPLLEEQTFHKDNRRVSIISFGAFPDGIVFHEEVFDSGPINDRVELFHSFDGSVFFERREEGDVRESEVGLHLFETHISSKAVKLKEISHENN